MQYGFDDLSTDATFGHAVNDKPIWQVKGDKDLHKWLMTELNHIEKESQDRISDVKKHIALYRGLQYYTQETRSSNRDSLDVTSKARQRTVVNHLFDFTEQRISRAVKFRPNVAITPVNDTNEDRYSSKIAKQFYDQIHEQETLDSKDQDAIRKAVITGETWTFVEWDPDKGPELDVEGIEHELMELVDKDAYESGVKVGDLCIKNYLPNRVFCELVEDAEKMNYLFKMDLEEVEVLKKEYPRKASDIHAESMAVWDNRKMAEIKMPRHAIVYTFYHRKTKYCPKGYYIKFTKDVVLENRALPYDHGEIPAARLPDIQVPGELHGRSFYVNIGPLQGHINNLTSMIMRNQYMAAHPKWLVPLGSTKLESLGNDMTVVQYRGAQAPVLSQANPTGRETFELRKLLIEESGQISGIYGVSRGEPPPGIKAGVALQFLSEQENERQNAFLGNVGEYRKAVAKLIIKTAAQFYKPEDNRTVRVVGKENLHMVEALDPKHLAKDFDIRIQNTSALPKNVAARAQYIIDLTQAYPNLFTSEQIIDMLDLANENRFKQEATSAVRHAEECFEMLCEGKDPGLPQEYEDHLMWWRIFASKVQEMSFKRLSEDKKTMVLAHLNAREMMMFDKAQANPVFAQALQTIPNYPLVFVPDVPQVPLEPLPELPGEKQQPMDLQMMAAMGQPNQTQGAI